MIQGFEPYGWTLARVVDADTMVINVDHGCNLWVHNRYVRLCEAGSTGTAFFDAVEKREPKGKDATKFVEEWLSREGVRFFSYKDRTGKYGRLLGNFRDAEGVWLTDALRGAGFEKD